MIDLIASVMLWVVQQMLTLLPDSPFLNGFSFNLSGLITGIGWLNWLVDIDGCVTVFELWLLALASFYTWKIGYKIFAGLGGFRSVGESLGTM